METTGLLCVITFEPESFRSFEVLDKTWIYVNACFSPMIHVFASKFQSSTKSNWVFHYFIYHFLLKRNYCNLYILAGRFTCLEYMPLLKRHIVDCYSQLFDFPIFYKNQWQLLKKFVTSPVIFLKKARILLIFYNPLDL